MAVREVDLFDLEFWGAPQREREELFARLRAEELPVFCPTPDGHGCYALTRYDDVLAASRNTAVFSSEPIATSPDDPPPDVMEFAGSIISLDAPRHTRLRRIVSRAFTPRLIGQMADDIAAIARELVGDLALKGPGDFVADVAAPMPMRVMFRMLGIPDSMQAEMTAVTDMVLGAGDPNYVSPTGEDRSTTLIKKYRKLHELMGELVKERRQRPGDDLVTKLISANVDGESLTAEELGKFFTLLIVAGSETARNTIAHTLDLLTEHPAQRALLLSDLPARLPGAIEEVVRFATPTTWMRRTLTSDFELAGHTYRAGDRVILFYNSANRDERAFTDPAVFDITRDPNPHVAFGAPGPHFCLGANLARHQIAVLFRELFARLPQIRAAGPGERHRSSFVNGFKSLPCEF
ncbi:cytochrome P450 [Actinomadura chibensis]|uniref:Cytochrome P450 n=1 Tax=Actinomadura chibensis TaxID=392828 RepID=A0A5D0NPE0_9ACTN|nr:cytochrome P450 [Actinomadura chibensis]TYB46396.1 cytochrome P450 [Actinomadura chibensis]